MLPAVIQRIPPPRGDPAGDLRLLLFDAYHDEYRWRWGGVEWGGWGAGAALKP